MKKVDKYQTKPKLEEAERLIASQGLTAKRETSHKERKMIVDEAEKIKQLKTENNKLKEENTKLKESLMLVEWEYRELKDAFSAFIQAIRGAADAVEEAIFFEEDDVTPKQ